MRKFPLYGITSDLKCQCGKADCGSPGKHPIIKNWKRDATDKQLVLDRWVVNHPGCNWGIATGDGLLVVDIDGDEGAASWADLIRENCEVTEKSVTLDLKKCESQFLEGAFTVLTGRGTHLYFSYDSTVHKISNSASKIAKCIDIRADGGYVVAAGSRHVSGSTYEAELSNAEFPPEIPGWLLALLVPRVEKGSRNSELTSEAGRLRREGLECDEIMAKLTEYNAARCVPPLPPSEVAAVAKSICRYEKGTGPSVNRYKSGDFASLCDLMREPADRAKALESEGELWYDTLRDLEMCGGEIVSDILALRAADNIAKLFVSPTTTRQVSDAQGNVSVKTIPGKPIVFSKQFCSDAISRVAHETEQHPVAKFLRSLPPWDKVERLSHVAEDLLGCTTALEAVYLRKWFISAAARALRPGCKADTALVLVGKQGIGKSSFFAELAGKEFFSDTACMVGTKDALSAVGRCWVYEWSELAVLVRSKQSEDVKSFLAAPVDTYRPAYGRREIVKPRSCVVVGTTNQDSFIGDDTGSRRFWVCRVPDTINLGAIRAIREQLWAEAVVAFDAGENWWLTEAEETKREIANQEHAMCNDDPWKELILTGLNGKTWVSSRALLDLVCSDLEYATAREARRIASICKQAGFEQRRQHVGGIVTRGWSPAGKATPELERIVVPFQTGD